VYAYFAEIARNSPIDLTLYNIPAFASPIDVNTIRRLADGFPRVIGIKDSSGDLAFMMRMIAAIRPNRPDFTFLTGWEAVLLLAIFACVPQVQAQQSAPGRVKISNAPVATAIGDADSGAIQDQLIKLLRLSPTLTTVVARDPTLLADKDYVARNNPELAKFLVAHPEVVRNPDFYLFSHLPRGNGRRDEVLTRSIWPDLVPAPQQVAVPESPQAQQWAADRALEDMMGPLAACLGFLAMAHPHVSAEPAMEPHLPATD